MDVGRSDRAARSGRDGFLEGGGKGSQTLSLWVKKKQNVWSEENDIAMVLGVGHYSWGSIRSTSPECAWHQRLWLELRAQGCGGGACVTEGRWNKAVGTLHSETRKRVTEDPVVGGGGQVGHGLRGQWKQGQNSANRTPVVWRRERLQEERSHRSLCPLLTLHCFWQLYLCYGFSFTLSHLSFPLFFSSPCLPLSVVGSPLPLRRLHPMTFCKHFIRKPLVFSKVLRQTDRAAVNRARNRGSRSVESFAQNNSATKLSAALL